MSTVRSTVRSKTLYAPPLSRRRLVSATPILRVLFGGIFISWSWIATITLIGWVLEPLMRGNTLHIISDRHLVGLLFAVSISVTEFATSEDWPNIYWPILLLLDASFTSMQTYIWLSTMVGARMPLILPIVVTLGLVSLVLGVLVARFGELLLFGHSQARGD